MRVTMTRHEVDEVRNKVICTDPTNMQGAGHAGRRPCRRIDGTCWQWCRMVWFPLQAPWTGEDAGNGSPFYGNLIKDSHDSDKLLELSYCMEKRRCWQHVLALRFWELKCCMDVAPVPLNTRVSTQHQSMLPPTCSCSLFSNRKQKCRLLPTTLWWFLKSPLVWSLAL